MIHATRFVAGVALKNIGAGLVTVTLTQVEGGSRARAAARFMVDVQHASMGDGERVRFIDARGYPEALQLGQVVQWLSKHMSGGAVSVRINVTDATRLPAPWTPSRINAMAAKFAAVDADALRDDAAAKVATVTSWADSGRRAAVLDAAARMGECAAFVEWVRGERAEWPGAGDDVIEPPPPPPAPAPEPPAPAPEPPAPAPEPPAPPPAPAAPTARAALRVSQPKTVALSSIIPMGVLVVGGEKLSGMITPAEPVAWYSLAVADGQWIGVERFAAVGVDTRIALYSEAGQVLAITDARFELNNPESGIADNFTIGAGSYLVGVGLRPVTFNHDFAVNAGAVTGEHVFEIAAVELVAAPPIPTEPPTADYVLDQPLRELLASEFHAVADGWRTQTIGMGLGSVPAWGDVVPVLMNPEIDAMGLDLLQVECAPVAVESIVMSVAPRPHLEVVDFDTQVALHINTGTMIAFRLVGEAWEFTAAAQTTSGDGDGSQVDQITYWPKTAAAELRWTSGATQVIQTIMNQHATVNFVRVSLSSGALARLEVRRDTAPPPPPEGPVQFGVEPQTGNTEWVLLVPVTAKQGNDVLNGWIALDAIAHGEAGVVNSYCYQNRETVKTVIDAQIAARGIALTGSVTQWNGGAFVESRQTENPATGFVGTVFANTLGRDSWDYGTGYSVEIQDFVTDAGRIIGTGPAVAAWLADSESITLELRDWWEAAPEMGL